MFRSPFIALLVGSLGLAGLPALAASSTSSAASEGVSASVGSVSTSFEKSSASSTGGDKKAEGPYRITEMAEAPTRPGLLRLALKAEAGDHELVLLLPKATADGQQLAVGVVIQATPQTYGVQFAKPLAREPFYLVLNDDWFDAMKTTRVTL